MNPKSAALVRTLEGDVIVIPIVLSRTLGIAAAAFLRQAAYFSAINERMDGWFYFEQQGEGDPEADSIYRRAGSWEKMLGIGPDAQQAIRSKLKELGLLEESRKGMVHGRLQYRVDPDVFLDYLGSCGGGSGSAPAPAAQSAIPVCSTRDTAANNPALPTDTNQGEKTQKQAAASGRVSRPPCAAAVDTHERSHRRLRHRASGIVTWYDEEIREAEWIEMMFHPEDILQAVKTITSRQGRSGKPLYPVPGLVRHELVTMTKRRQAEAQLSQRLSTAPDKTDPAMAARGLEMLPPNMRKRMEESGRGVKEDCSESG